jgi:two-component system cell cycle sensor histidine kinase/response regulator CckA
MFGVPDRNSTMPATGSCAAGGDDDGRPMLLIVEDHDEVRAVFRGALERAGFAVVEADCAARAARVFAAHIDQIELVVLDFELPDRDGASVLRELRTARANLPVILCSGYVDQGAHDAFPPGALNAIVPKPCAPSAVVRLVRELLA